MNKYCLTWNGYIWIAASHFHLSFHSHGSWRLISLDKIFVSVTKNNNNYKISFSAIVENNFDNTSSHGHVVHESNIPGETG